MDTLRNYQHLHDISKLDLFLAKFLLIFLQPGLIVLDEQMNCMT